MQIELSRVLSQRDILYLRDLPAGPAPGRIAPSATTFKR